MKATKIVFLILPRTHLLDLAGPLQVFQEAAEFSTDLSIEYCTTEKNPFSFSSGLPLGKIKHFEKIDLSEGDYLIVPGIDMALLNASHSLLTPDLRRWITLCYHHGARICSVCTGAFIIASTGLLNGKRCTTHWKYTAYLQSKYPQALVQEDVLFTEDNRIYTSAGVASGIDLALHLVSRMRGDQVSFKVARELVVYMRRNGNESQQSIFMQYRNHVHSGIHKVQDYMQDRLEDGATLPALSEVACMSTRNLTRTFKRETGITINEYLNLVRKEKLQELVKNPNLTRRQLARYCGLKSERHVIRLLNQ